jgi:phenylacetate-CoA ligase
MHATNFFNYVEILDENDRRTEPGQPGRVVVTALFNPALPLFRYEIGDIAAWDEPCQHGISLPVLSPILTRMRDAFIEPNGAYRIGSFVRSRALAESLVGTYQPVVARDGILLLYTRGPFARGNIEDILLQDIIDIYGPGLPVRLIESQDLDWLGRWKRQQLLRLDQDFGPEPTEQQLRDALMASGYRPDAGLGALVE